jgi:NarL family two-component system response regulator LiaR
MYQIVLIDDHVMIREGFTAYFNGSGRFHVAGAAASLAEARELFETDDTPPDLVLTDIELGEDDGLEIISWLAARYGEAAPPTLVYSIFEDTFRVQRAIQAGAKGYVSKAAPEEEISRAVEAVLRGETWLEERLLPKVEETERPYRDLTYREKAILELVKHHYDNRHIARETGLTTRTVENYLYRIYEKTGVKTREGLIKF